MKLATVYFYLLSIIVFGCSTNGTHLFIEPESFSPGKEIFIYGRVIDFETNEPLVGAEIYSNDGKVKAFVDIDGNYLIRNVQSGVYNIHYKLIGYKEIALSNINFEYYKSYILDFRLKAQPYF